MTVDKSKWYVVKNEWGFWVSDWPAQETFEDAVTLARQSQHYNVVKGSLFALIDQLPQIKKPDGEESR